MLRVQIPVRSANKIGLRMMWRPGQHVFIRFLSVGVHSLTAHPFSICSLPPSKNKDERCEVVLLIKPQKGFTSRLAKMAKLKPGTAVPVGLDGPYGGLSVRSLSDFDRALIIAGGSGIGFTLPIIEDILHRKDFERRGAGRVTRIHVIVAIRSLEMRDWFLMEIQRLLYRYYSAEFLKVEIHITTSSLRYSLLDKAPAFEDWTIRANTTMSSSISVKDGRPNLGQFIEEASTTPSESVGVVCCGPRGMVGDVRDAAANVQLDILQGRGTSELYLHTETFGW